MLSLILVEAALEAVPAKIASHPSVVNSARRFGVAPSRMLLDVSYHYAAMRRLEQKWKRGRPDIVHGALLECMGSPMIRRGMMNAAVHTVGGTAITINPKVRLPRNYVRFARLFAELLSVGKVEAAGKGETLLMARAMELKRLIRELDGSHVVLLAEDGHRTRLLDLARSIMQSENTAVLVGAFAHGDFNPETVAVADEAVSIYPGILDTSVVVSRILAGCELVSGIM